MLLLNYYDMTFLLNNSWLLFCILFGLMLLVTIVMNLQSLHFVTKDVVVRKFSIIDLQLAASPTELVSIIKGLYELSPSQSKKAINALKGQLYIDFLFMPCAYGSVFLLCIRIAERIQFSLGKNVFMFFAWLQLLSWIFNIIENIYLLRKINPNPVTPEKTVHNAFLIMEAAKWAIVLTGAVCSVSAICYFWLAGHYSFDSLHYAVIVLAEIILFLIAQFFVLREEKVWLKAIEADL